MSDTPKYYRTVFHFEVLSDEPLGEMSLKDIDYHITDGHMSGAFLGTFETEVSAEQMETLLDMQLSDPTFLLGETWPLKKELKELEAAFEIVGGRSVELTERIDELREQIEDFDSLNSL